MSVPHDEPGLTPCGDDGCRVCWGDETAVPTALDFPDCRACQMWKDAGASWPRPCRQHYGGEWHPVTGQPETSTTGHLDVDT